MAVKIQEVEILRQPEGDIVDTLEWLMELAKSGELRGFAFATLRPGSFAGQGWASAEDANLHVLLASVNYLQHRMTARMVECSDEEEG